MEPTEEINSRKRRKPDSADFPSSAAFKIRSVFKGLRPHFVDVLRAPDFRNCDAASEIRRQMQVLIELTKQLRTEAAEMGMKKTRLDHQTESGNQNTQHPHRRPTSKPPEKITFLEEMASKYTPGSYVIGHSPIGWNFLVFPGLEPKYYGESKEIFRSRRSRKC